ncbi:hypothetical protein [Nitrosopumilus sp.]|uniref:hypothetical protein n=1 Tax=Nitrosopumilus sp. TaxID=2024843 RepID=UPI0034A028BD
MSKQDIPINYSKNKLILCAYCIKIKGRSKRFNSIHALTWHVTHNHQDDMGIVDISGVLS